MLGNKPLETWIAEYSRSHQHPVNRVCHTFGIPTIALSLPLFVATAFWHRLWPVPASLFLLGWAFHDEQRHGHGPQTMPESSGDRTEEHTAEIHSPFKIACPVLP